MLPQSGTSEERVGSGFQVEALVQARARAWALLNEIQSKIEPGMTEADTVLIYQKCLQQSGAERQWHPPKIRFGVNTLRAFREPSVEGVRLQKSDIFFIDIGPIYDGYEADVGRTFAVGDDSIHRRAIETAESIFNAIGEIFRAGETSGAELYSRAEKMAVEAEYELVGEGANGHRLSEFPHAVHYRGNLRGFQNVPSPHRWVLEIQIRDRKHGIGAFFEDLI